MPGRDLRVDSDGVRAKVAQGVIVLHRLQMGSLPAAAFRCPPEHVVGLP